MLQKQKKFLQTKLREDAMELKVIIEALEKRYEAQLAE